MGAPPLLAYDVSNLDVILLLSVSMASVCLLASLFSSLSI